MPYWAGVVVVGAVITLNVSLGGMKGITLVQAFQYWLKVFAITLPIFVLASVSRRTTSSTSPPTRPPRNAVAAAPAGIERKALPAKAPKDEQWIAPFGKLTTKAVDAAIAAAQTPEAKAELEANKQPYSLLYTYSLIIALVCGTAGVPHILVRFYTNPDGVAAKRTTMWVMILIGVFYVFPPVYGVIGRSLTPELYDAVGAKGTDKVVLELPTLLAGRRPCAPRLDPLGHHLRRRLRRVHVDLLRPARLDVQCPGARHLRPHPASVRLAGTAPQGLQVVGPDRGPDRRRPRFAGRSARDQLHGRAGLRHRRRQLLPAPLHERLVARHDHARRRPPACSSAASARSAPSP
jgi:hypothetical protein